MKKYRIVSNSHLFLAIDISYFVLNFIIYNVHIHHFFSDIIFLRLYLPYLFLNVKGICD